MVRVPVIVVAVILLLALTANPALADTEQVTRTSSNSVSGADALAGVLREVERVQIGSASTTVTLQDSAEQEPIVLEYSSITGGDGPDDQGGNALVPLLTLSVGAAALRSVLRLISGVSRFGARVQGR